jgi:hypothetical protein
VIFITKHTNARLVGILDQFNNLLGEHIEDKQTNALDTCCPVKPSEKLKSPSGETIFSMSLYPNKTVILSMRHNSSKKFTFLNFPTKAPRNGLPINRTIY